MLFKRKQKIKEVYNPDESLIRTMGYLRPTILKCKTSDPQNIVDIALKNNPFIKSDINWGLISKRRLQKNFNRFIKTVHEFPEILKEAEHGAGYLAYCIEKAERNTKEDLVPLH